MLTLRIRSRLKILNFRIGDSPGLGIVRLRYDVREDQGDSRLAMQKFVKPGEES